MQAELIPTPNEKLAEKYDYFYRGYNLDLNTKRYMTFDDEYDPKVLSQFQNLIQLEEQSKE